MNSPDITALADEIRESGELDEERALGLLDQIEELRTRRDELLATIARISQTVPLESEVAEALEQRGALLAEVGTLKARVAELELETNAMATESIRSHAEYKARRNEQFAAYEELLAAKDGEGKIAEYKIAIDKIKDERIALHQAWFGTVGVLTPGMLANERVGHDFDAKTLAVKIEELGYLKEQIRAFARTQVDAEALGKQLRELEDQAGILMVDLIASVEAPDV